MSNQSRFILSEYNNIKDNNAQTRLLSESRLINLRFKPKKNMDDCMIYKKDDLLNNVSAEEFNIYVNYKKKYNDYFSKRKKN